MERTSQHTSYNTMNRTQNLSFDENFEFLGGKEPKNKTFDKFISMLKNYCFVYYINVKNLL